MLSGSRVLAFVKPVALQGRIRRSRSVGYVFKTRLRLACTNHQCRKPLHQDDATRATEARLPNGAAGLTVQGLCATLAVFVSSSAGFLLAYDCSNIIADYAKLTRKLGAKAALASSNLRPKSPGPGRETA